LPTLPVLSSQADQHGHLHSIDDACLAMLAALLLALIAALTRRSVAAAHPVQLAGAVPLVTNGDPSASWRRPTLSMLRVLRI
jgi:hypothetical protein